MSKKTIKIAPSILSADFLNLGKDIEMLNSSNAEPIHFDVMDGHFVPNISFGFPLLQSIAKISKKPIDVHLMIEKPENYIERFVDCGANYLSVHLEGNYHLNRTLDQIKKLGAKAGIVLNPQTPVAHVAELLPFCDFVLLMSVNPGYGGQKFIPHTLKKVAELRQLINNINDKVEIEVDGGISLENSALLASAGADILVAGNSVFASKDPLLTIDKLSGKH